MDLRFRGDACVRDGPDGCLELCLGNFSFAQVSGTSLDLPHLNALVGRLRQPPRGRTSGVGLTPQTATERGPAPE